MRADVDADLVRERGRAHREPELRRHLVQLLGVHAFLQQSGGGGVRLEWPIKVWRYQEGLRRCWVDEDRGRLASFSSWYVFETILVFDRTHKYNNIIYKCLRANIARLHCK